jgi:nucleoside-diphosphate-sugar epimerase
MKRKILLTGASGLLGSNLARRLAEKVDLVALGIRPIDGIANIAADLSDELDVSRLPKRVDAIIYLAQSRRFREFPGAAAHVAAVNVISPFALAAYAVEAGAKSFIYASTGGVYAPGPQPVSEESALEADFKMSNYAATKRAAELMLAPFANQFALVILRPFFIYGAGQDRSMLLPRLADSVASGTPISLAGPDGIRINPVHADDAALAVEAALRLTSSHRINVAGPETLSLREMVEELGRRLGKRPVYQVDQSSVRADLVGDISLMERLLHTPRERFLDRIGEVLQ